MLNKNYKYLTCILLMFIGSGCNKETDWLSKKPSKSIVVPTTLTDFDQVLNNTIFTVNASPILGSLAVEDFTVTDASWNSVSSASDRNSYIWAKDIFEGNLSSDWLVSYKEIYFSNVVLDGLKSITPSTANQGLYNKVMGTAKFYRAFAFYDMAELFCKPYSAAAPTDLGLPLRQSSVPTDVFPRATLAETYTLIVNDLEAAVAMLPVNADYKTHPSRNAAKALLARVYLAMENYNKAFQYADEVLQDYSFLYDYSTLPTTSAIPIPKYGNQELYYREGLFDLLFYLGAQVPQIFYDSYSDNDLRKTVFFNKTSSGITFKTTYTGGALATYSGLGTDEVYLIRAEANARLGRVSQSMQDLNLLLRNRYKKNLGISTYIDQTATDETDAVKKIMAEKRKELLFRGTRWMDLRRLNKDPRFVFSITRTINGQVYVLQPNDLKKYVYPIPEDEIRYTGIQQNER